MNRKTLRTIVLVGTSMIVLFCFATLTASWSKAHKPELIGRSHTMITAGWASGPFTRAYYLNSGDMEVVAEQSTFPFGLGSITTSMRTRRDPVWQSCHGNASSARCAEGINEHTLEVLREGRLKTKTTPIIGNIA